MEQEKEKLELLLFLFHNSFMRKPASCSLQGDGYISIERGSRVRRAVLGITLRRLEQMDNIVEAGIGIEHGNAVFIRCAHHAKIIAAKLDLGARDRFTAFIDADHTIIIRIGLKVVILLICMQV